MRIFAAGVYVMFGSLLFTACGSGEQESPGEKTEVDSTEHRQDIRSDSVTRTESASVNSGKPVAPPLDSAELMSTLEILDSIAAARNK